MSTHHPASIGLSIRLNVTIINFVYFLASNPSLCKSYIFILIQDKTDDRCKET